jgi:hypothetical protein
METRTFIFIDQENGHFSKSVVTAETKEECNEKYFLKYPERQGDDRVEVFEGDREDLVPALSAVNYPLNCKNCGHMGSTHVPSPIALSDVCLVDDCTCVLYKAKGD